MKDRRSVYVLSIETRERLSEISPNLKVNPINMTNQISRKVTVFFLVLMIGLTPVLSYAKDKENKKYRENDRQEQTDNNEGRDKRDRSCFRAFGHFFAHGFIKNRGEVNFFGNCFLPFGIGKKFIGMASSTPDIIPPIIKRVSLLVGTSTASVGWKTNENATSRVYYGTSASLDVNASTTNFIENSTPKKNHFLTLSSLAISTTYYLAIESKDESGNKTVTPTFTAITNGL